MPPQHCKAHSRVKQNLIVLDGSRYLQGPGAQEVLCAVMAEGEGGAGQAMVGPQVQGPPGHMAAVWLPAGPGKVDALEATPHQYFGVSAAADRAACFHLSQQQPVSHGAAGALLRHL